MNSLDIISIAIALLGIIAAIITVILCRRKTRNTLEHMNKMLESAINGSFSESIFDESLLSSVEAELAQYLSLCSVSSKNLLEEKNKINQLISDISHQTKTPIANILLYSQLLSEYNLPEECIPCVNALSSQAEKLNFLIGSLVKASRLENGIITVTPQITPIKKLFSEVIEQIIVKATSKSILISMDDNGIQAYFDNRWTGEALYNIIDNAVKYTPIGGVITISAQSYELFCRIDIKDNGIGISENEQNKIFTRFYRSKAVSDREGVGIGLFLARQIITVQGGYIKVTSELEHGSTFSLFLPLTNKK